MIHWSRSKLNYNLAEHLLVKYEWKRAQEYFSSIQKKSEIAFGFRSCREIPGFLDLISREFSNKCVYCEQQLATSADREIALFRPSQLESRHQEETGQHHYWWLNWEWSNLVLSCHQCNWNKAASFPIAGPRAKEGDLGGALQKENPLLLDPCRDLPDQHLLFLDNGEVIPANDSIKGRTTIETFDLNRAELIQARCEEAKKLQTIIDLTHPRDYSKLFSIETSDDRAFIGLRLQLLNRELASTSSNQKPQKAISDSDTLILQTDSTVIRPTLPLVPNSGILKHGNLVDRVLEQRWRIDKKIGEGGMGKIYLARDMRLSMRKIVVKIPDAEQLKLQAVRTLFEKEVDILIEHPHPNIVKVEDRGEVDGIPFVVLQYLEGGNLKDLIAKKKSKMSGQEIFNWLFPVARALDFLHQENTLHRDVKPGNILFDKCGHAFLADFGIAKVLGQKDSQQQQGLMFSGTEKYMAPDDELTPFYDQYSLGLVVLEELNGKVPGLKKCMQGITRGFIPDCSREVQDVMLRALNSEPVSRFGTCLAFAHSLKKSIEG